MSGIVVGQAVTIVRPQVEGVWAGMTVVWSPEACLPGPVNWSPSLAIPIPESVSIYARNVLVSSQFNILREGENDLYNS